MVRSQAATNQSKCDNYSRLKTNVELDTFTFTERRQVKTCQKDVQMLSKPNEKRYSNVVRRSTLKSIGL